MRPIDRPSAPARRGPAAAAAPAALRPRPARRLWPLLAALLAFATLLAACGSAGLGGPATARRAEALWESGDEAGAAAEFERRLAEEPAAADRLLFRLALLYASPASAAHLPERSAELLRRLLDEYPRSPYRGPAAAVLALTEELVRQSRKLETEARRLQARAGRLQREIEDLTAQLEELKRIDLERRRQPPR